MKGFSMLLAGDYYGDIMRKEVNYKQDLLKDVCSYVQCLPPS